MRLESSTAMFLRVFGVTVVFLILVLGWPTPYRYTKASVGLPDNSVSLIRINRFTGRASFLTYNGWIPCEYYTPALPTK